MSDPKKCEFCDLPANHDGGHVLYVSSKAFDQLQRWLAEDADTERSSKPC